MSNHEMSGFGEDIKPIDFGEPTPETRERLEQVFDALKGLTAGIPYRGELALTEGGIGKRPPSSDIGPVTEYSYIQTDDPLFDKTESTYLSFRVLEADDATFNKLIGEFGDYALADVDYYDGVIEICYRKSLYDEMLHVSDYKVAEFDAPDFHEKLSAIIDSVEGARETGADKPTDGTMRQLIAVLEQEIAKRVQ